LPHCRAAAGKQFHSRAVTYASMSQSFARSERQHMSLCYFGPMPSFSEQFNNNI
jgi:hypothetical protein